MYPRFNSICLAYQRKQLQQHSRNISYAPPLSIKVFTKSESLQWEYSAQKLFLFLAMLNVSEPSTSPSRITSSPSHSPAPSTEHSPDHTTTAVSFPSPTQPTQPSPETEQHIPTPHDSPLHVVHSHGSDEGSLKLIELTNLVTKLSERIGVLEDDLKKTKLTYSAAVTKLILRGMKSDVEVQGKASTETEPIIQEVTPTEVIQDQGSSEKGNSEVSTAGATKGTASEVLVVSTAEENISTAGRTVTYRRRSEEERTRKDKGKAIMTEPEPKEESKQRLNKKGDGSSKNYKILSEMLEDFDRQDVMTYTGLLYICNREKYPLSARDDIKELNKDSVTSSPNHPTSNINDAFSSNFPDYIPASLDYSPTSPGNTYSSSSNNSFGLVPIASPTISLFHDDPYMKVVQAYYAKESPIPPPTIVPPSPMLSPMFNSQEFFLPEELLPHKKRGRDRSSSSTSVLP
ncbi:hypothetical protein Tco_0179927 [Tanacetum coccineum]